MAQDQEKIEQSHKILPHICFSRKHLFFFLVQLFSKTPGLIYHSLNLQIYTLTQFSSWFPSVSCLHHFCQSTSGLVISKQVLGLVTELWLPQERLSSWGGQEHWTERVRLFYILEMEWREWSQKSMTEADQTTYPLYSPAWGYN